MAAKDVVVAGCSNSTKKNSIVNVNSYELAKTSKNRSTNVAMETSRSAIPCQVPSGTSKSTSIHVVSRSRVAVRKSRQSHREPKVRASQSRLSLTYLCRAWQELRNCESVSELPRYVHALFCTTVRFTLSSQWTQIKPNQRENLRHTLLLFRSRACHTFAGLLPEPWGEAYTAAMKQINAIYRNASDSSEEDLVRHFPHVCKETCIFEPRDVKHARIELLCYAGCKREALRLCLFYRRCPILASDQFIAESTFQLLYHLGSVKHIIDEMESFSCHDGFQLIQIMLHKEGPTVQPLIECMTQILLVRDLVGPSTYCCTLSLMNMWCLLHVKQKTDLDDVTREAHKLGALATTSAHLYLLVDVLYKQYGRSLLPLYLNLYVHALTIDINNLEYARQVDCRMAIAELETHMAAMYTKLASLLVSEEDLGLAHECVLTAFSLEPTLERLDHLQKWAEVRPSLWSYQHVIRPVPCEGECHCTEKGLCRRDPPLPSWFMTHVPNGILDSNLKGVSKQLLQDLCILVEGPRCRCLTWNMPWETLFNVCVHYLQTSHAHRAEADDRCVGIEARLRRLGPFSSSHASSLEPPQAVFQNLRKEFIPEAEIQEDTCNYTAEDNRQFVVPPLVIKKSACDPEFVVVDRTSRPVGACDVINAASHSLRGETKNNLHCENSSCRKDSKGSYLDLTELKMKKGISMSSNDSCTDSPEAIYAVRGSTTDIVQGLENFSSYDNGQNFEPFTDDRNNAEVHSLLNYKVMSATPALHTESLQLSLENNASNETPDPIATVMVSGCSRLPFETELLETTSVTELPRITPLYNSESAKAKSECCLPVTVPKCDPLKFSKVPPCSWSTSGCVKSSVPTVIECCKTEKMQTIATDESISTSPALFYSKHSLHLHTVEHRTSDSVKEHLDRLNMLSILAAERSDKLRSIGEQTSGSVRRLSSSQVDDSRALTNIDLIEDSVTAQKCEGSADVNCEMKIIPCSRNYSTATTTSVATTKESLSQLPSSLLAPEVMASPTEESTTHLCLNEHLEVNDMQEHYSLKTVHDSQNLLSSVAQSGVLQQEAIRSEEQAAVHILIAQQNVDVLHDESLSKHEGRAEFGESVRTNVGRNEAIVENQVGEEYNKSHDKLMELLRSFDILPLNEASVSHSNEPDHSSNQTVVTTTLDVAETVNDMDKVRNPDSKKLPTGTMTLESLVAETLQLTTRETSNQYQLNNTRLSENHGEMSNITRTLACTDLLASNAIVEMITDKKVTKEADHRLDGIMLNDAYMTNSQMITAGASTLIQQAALSTDESIQGIPHSQTLQSVPSVTFHQNYSAGRADGISIRSLPSVVYALPQQPHSSLIDHMYGESRLHHILTVKTSTSSAIPQQVSMTSVPCMTQVDSLPILGQHSSVFGGSANLQSPSIMVTMPQTSVSALPEKSSRERVISTNQILNTIPITSSVDHSDLHVAQTSNGRSLIFQQDQMVQTHVGLSKIHIGPSLGNRLTHIQLEPLSSVESLQSVTISSNAQIPATASADSFNHTSVPSAYTVDNRPTLVNTAPLQSVSHQKSLSSQDALSPVTLQVSGTSAVVQHALPTQSLHIALSEETVQDAGASRLVQSALAKRIPVMQAHLPLVQPALSATVTFTTSNQSVNCVQTAPVTSMQSSTSYKLSKSDPSKNEKGHLLNIHSQLSSDVNTPCETTRASQIFDAIKKGATQHITSSSASLLQPNVSSLSHNVNPNDTLTLSASHISDANNQVNSKIVHQLHTADKPCTVSSQLQHGQRSGVCSLTSVQCVTHSNVGFAETEVCQKPFFVKDIASQETIPHQPTKSLSPVPISNSLFHLPYMQNDNSSSLLEESLGLSSDQEVLESSVEIKPKIVVPEKLTSKPIAGRKIIIAHHKDRKWVSVRSAHGVMGYRKIDYDDSKPIRNGGETDQTVTLSTPTVFCSMTSDPSCNTVTTACAASSNIVTGAVLPLSSTVVAASTLSASLPNTVTSATPNVPLVKKCYSPATLNNSRNTGTISGVSATSAITSSSMCKQDLAQDVQSNGHPVVDVPAKSLTTPLSNFQTTTQSKSLSVSLQNSSPAGLPKTVAIGSRVLALHPKSVVLPVHHSLHSAKKTTSTVNTQSSLEACKPTPVLVAVNQQSSVSQSSPLLVSIQKSAQSSDVPHTAAVKTHLKTRTLPSVSANTTLSLHSVNTATGSSALLSQPKLVLEIPTSLQGAQSKFVIRSQPISSSLPMTNTTKGIQSTQFKQVLIPSPHLAHAAGSKAFTVRHQNATMSSSSVKIAVPGVTQVMSSKVGQSASVNLPVETVMHGGELKSSAVVTQTVSPLPQTSGPQAGVILQSAEKSSKPVSQHMLPAVNLKSGLSTFVSIAKSYLVQNKEKTLTQQSSVINTPTANIAILSQTPSASLDDVNRVRTLSGSQPVEISPNCKRKSDYSQSSLSKKKQCPVCQKFLSSSHCLRRHLNAVHHVTPSSSGSTSQSNLPKKLMNPDRHEKATNEQVELLVRRIMMESSNLNTTKSSAEFKVHTQKPLAGKTEAKVQLCEQIPYTHCSMKAIESECTINVMVQTSDVNTKVELPCLESATHSKISLSEGCTDLKINSIGQDTCAEFQSQSAAQSLDPAVLLKEHSSVVEIQLSQQSIQTKEQSDIHTVDKDMSFCKQTYVPKSSIQCLTEITETSLETTEQDVQTNLQPTKHVFELTQTLSSPTTEVQAQLNALSPATTKCVSEIPRIELSVPSPCVDSLEHPQLLSNQTIATVVSERQNDNSDSSKPFICEVQSVSSDKKSLGVTCVKENDLATDEEQTKQHVESETEAEATELAELTSDEDEAVQMPLLVPVVALTPIDFDVHYSKELGPPKIEMVAMQPAVRNPHCREMRGRTSSRNIKSAQKRCCTCCENTSPNSSTNKRQCKNERLRRSNAPVLRKVASPKCTRKTRASGRNSKS